MISVPFHISLLWQLNHHFIFNLVHLVFKAKGQLLESRLRWKKSYNLAKDMAPHMVEHEKKIQMVNAK